MKMCTDIELQTQGSVTQKGTYIKNEEGNLLILSNDLGTKALYRRGILVWIKPKGHPRYTYKQIVSNN